MAAALARDVAAAERARNGDSLAVLLAFPATSSAGTGGGAVLVQKAAQKAAAARQLAGDAAELGVAGVWAPVLASHLRAVAAAGRGDWVEAHRHQVAMQGAFVRIFADAEDGRWLVPVLRAVNYGLHGVALRADEQLRRTGEVPNKLEEAARVMQNELRALNLDRAPLATSKKWAALDVANHLFRMYFKLNNAGRSRNVIKGLFSTQYPEISQFPPAEAITFNFYVGRLRLLEENFSEAEASLTDAFRACPESARRNKSLIMLYLCAARLALGQIPPRRVLARFELEDRVAVLADAVRLGDLRSYHNAMEANRDYFLRTGVYLAFEKAKTLAYRNLFRRCWSILGKPSKFLVGQFVDIFRWLGEEDVDLDDVECILANLIATKLIKGYISHQVRALVVSPKDPFPTPAR